MRTVLLTVGTLALAAALAPVRSPAVAAPVAAPVPREPPLVDEPPFVDGVEAWLRTRGIDYHAAARGRSETTLVLGDDLRLRLLPTPRRSEDCLDPGSSARLTDAAEAEGSSIIHLHEDTWRQRGAIVRDRLLNRVQATQRVFARKTKARPVDAAVAIAFLDEHHLWGPTNAKYAYGLFLRDELVAVATFTKRKLVKRGRGSKRRTHELLRFCARRDMRVVGGITKLLSAFRKDRDVDDFVTNIDRDWGGGAGWRAIGYASRVPRMTRSHLPTRRRDGIEAHAIDSAVRRRFETVEVMPPLPSVVRVRCEGAFHSPRRVSLTACLTG